MARRRRKMPVSNMGYLYLIESFDQGVAKIGHGNDPRRRRIQLQTGNPARLTLYCAVPAPYGVEAALQLALKDYRVGLEWFSNLPLLRDIFCHFESEVASLDFDDEIPMIGLDHIKDVPGLIYDHLEYVREYEIG